MEDSGDGICTGEVRKSSRSRVGRASRYRLEKKGIARSAIVDDSSVTFDASERAVCVLKRQSTSTPLQALVLLNDPQFIEASRVLAQSVIQDQPDGEMDWIPQVFQRLTSRYPNQQEMEKLEIRLGKLQDNDRSDS